MITDKELSFGPLFFALSVYNNSSFQRCGATGAIKLRVRGEATGCLQDTRWSIPQAIKEQLIIRIYLGRAQITKCLC